jgi:hypothetical protein
VFGPRCVAISQRTTAARLTKALYPQCRSRPASHRAVEQAAQCRAIEPSCEHSRVPAAGHSQTRGDSVAISQRTTAARLTKALYPQCRSRPASHRCHRLGSLHAALDASANKVLLEERRILRDHVADRSHRFCSQAPRLCTRSAEAAQPRIDAIALDLWRSSTLPSMYRARRRACGSRCLGEQSPAGRATDLARSRG